MENAKRVKLVLAFLGFSLALGLVVSYAPDRPLAELKPQWAPPPSQFIDVAGLSVHIRDEGPRDDAQPIVLIHGTGASLHTWQAWADALKGTRRVIRMDLPGFGLTGPNASGDYSDAAYVRFLLALLDRLGIQQCVLAGNSLGGEIAWQVAAAAPQRVAKLVLVDAAGYAFTSDSVPLGFRLARTPVLNKLMEFTLTRALVAGSVRNVYGNPEKVTPELIDRYMALTLREGNRRALVQRFAQLDNGAAAPKIKSLRQPTLIIWGGRDRLIPLRYAEQFNSDIIHSQLQIFKQLGHVPQEEDGPATVAVLQRFLSE